jgi:hypothetical protein
MKRNFFIGLLSIFLFSNSCFALDTINKDLSVRTGYLYLLSFDEKVLNYKSGNDEAVTLELLSNIFNDRHELIIKPVKELNTNLIVWTQNAVYNFNLSIDNNPAPKSPNLVHINNLEGLELDKPPHMQDLNTVFDTELDKPPGVN